MSAETVMHTVGVLTCATSLSLFTTIVAFAAINVAPLKWDGSLCANQCTRSAHILDDAFAVRLQVARAGVHKL